MPIWKREIRRHLLTGVKPLSGSSISCSTLLLLNSATVAHRVSDNAVFLYSNLVLISTAVAIAGYFILPDMPENSRAFYLSEEERAFARKRMELEGRKGRAPYTREKFKRIFSSWHIYMLTLLYVTFNNNGLSIPIFAQYLQKSQLYFIFRTGGSMLLNYNIFDIFLDW